MTIPDLLSLLHRCPIIASVQASEGSPLAAPATLALLARASQKQGVELLRLEGQDAIGEVQKVTGLPTIGLIKVSYPDSQVYITPSRVEVVALLEAGCEIIALDGTRRARPNGERLADLIGLVKAAGRLAMADCDCLESALFAQSCGADLIGTTLAGYTSESREVAGPDIDLLRALVCRLDVPVLAEGRFAEPWQVQTALRIGAIGVVIGGAINDPCTQTQRFVNACEPRKEPIGAVDIGGTWIRFATFDADWTMLEVVREPVQPDRRGRLDWIREVAREAKVDRLGISTGGTVDPATRVVWESKDIISNHTGTDFSELGDVIALNDGLASAWGHACLPQFAGKRVATLALGTGVGFGLVDQGHVFMGQRGGYPRINDLETGLGGTFEEILGGASLSEDRGIAQEAATRAVATIRNLYYPDEIVLCGGVGLADWLDIDLPRSPFGANAGLYGAAALVLFAPVIE